MKSIVPKLMGNSKSQQYLPTKPMACQPRRIVKQTSFSPTKRDEETKPRKSEPKVDKLSLQMFDIGKPLGNGKFGNVYLAKLKKCDYVCAIKVVFKKQIKKHDMTVQIKREIELQSHFNHPNILKLLGFFEDDEKWYLVLEYCKKGELFSILQRYGRFPEKTAARYIKSTAEALKYLQDNCCIHRDLKPENIMIDHNDQVKLADFGWSVHTNTKRNTYCGTLDYLCPEIINSKYYDGAVDQWCLGVLTYELVTGEPPFQSDRREEFKRKVRTVTYKLPAYLSAECKDFIDRLLQSEPTKRMGFLECLNHPWIKMNTK